MVTKKFKVIRNEFRRQTLESVRNEGDETHGEDLNTWWQEKVPTLKYRPPKPGYRRYKFDSEYKKPFDVFAKTVSCNDWQEQVNVARTFWMENRAVWEYSFLT